MMNHAVEVEAVTVGEAMRLWLRAEEERCRPATRHNLKGICKRFLPDNAAIPLEELSTARIAAWLTLRGREVRARTLALDFTLLKWFLAWCVRRELLERNPMARLDPPRYPETVIRTIEPEEEAKVLAACDPPLKRYLILALETGLRRGTLLGLRWGMLDLTAGWLHIPGSIMKSGRALDIPLSWRALQSLASLPPRPPGEHIFEQNPTRLANRLKEAQQIAKVRPFTLHDCRRTFLTRSRRRGVPLEVAMALSDHRDISTVLRCYRQVDRSDLLKGVGR